MKIDFFPQARLIDGETAACLVGNLRTIAARYDATVFGREDPFTASFDEGNLFHRFQCIEAISAFSDYLSGLDDALMGYAILAHRGNDTESIVGALRKQWCAIPPDNSAWLSKDAAEILAPYVIVEGKGAELRFMGSSYRTAEPVPPALDFTLRKDDISALADAFGDAFTIDGVRLVFVRYPPQGELSAPLREAFSELGYSPDGFPILTAGVMNARPYEAFFDSSIVPARADIDAYLGSHEKTLLDRTRPAFEALADNPYKTFISERIRKGVIMYLTLCVRVHARKLAGNGIPAVIAFRNLHRFSPESIDFIGRLVQGDEDICLVCASEEPPPEVWRKFDMRIIEVGPSGSGDYRDAAGSVENAIPLEQLWKLSSGSPLDLFKRVLLWKRGRKKSAVSRAPVRIQVLELLPVEADLLLYAAGRAENILSGSQFSDFLTGLGLLPDGAALLARILRDHGFLDREKNTAAFPLLPGDFPPRSAAGRRAIDDALSACMIGLYRKRRLVPSLGLLEATLGDSPSGGAGENRFALDCALDDAFLDPPDDGTTGAPATTGENVDFPGLSFDPYSVRAIAAALESSDRDACESALAHAEAGKAEREFGAGVLALMRSDVEYARKDPVAAADDAKRALLHFRHADSPRAESFALRMLGLGALAQEHAIEAADYFSSSCDVAESSHQDYERMVSSWYSACTHFIRGELSRAIRHADAALASSRAVCRKDWEGWLDFFKGRVHFEAGEYAEAIARFSEARCTARVYGLAGAERRCLVWTARAEAYAGMSESADRLLANLAGSGVAGSGVAGDGEAAFFRGELRLIRGDFAGASEMLSLVNRPETKAFVSAERISWDSGFMTIENRGPGFSQPESIDADYSKACTLFAKGMAESDPDCARALFAMTREERIAENNPFSMQYYLFCFLILETLTAPPIDRVTVLSRAYRHFQERSSRIDDHALKASFHEKNIWSLKLLEAARRYKFF
ncbi:MAG: hypothetical protein NT080_12980 [Spirochaetes bacterium]|nr:hypothetical protein [Spirochaetota bacterium]